MLRRSFLHNVLLALGAISLLTVLVFLPSFYLLTFIFTRWDEIYNEIFAHPLIGDTYWKEIGRYLSLSLRLALTTILIDLIIGVPLAYLLSRGSFPGKSLLEDLTMLPLVIPTSGFGFATMLAWTASYGLPAILGFDIKVDTLVPMVNVPLLMLIIHVALTFPYVVKTVCGALRDIGKSYEIIASSLGSKPITTFRKITMPLIVPSLLSGLVLAFARSLGETGATMIVAGVSTTAPIAVVKWEFENKLAPAAFLGALLVGISLAIIVPIEYLASSSRRARRLIPLGVEVLLVRWERKAPGRLRLFRDIISLLSIALLVLLPIAVLAYNAMIYWRQDPYTGRMEGGILYQLYGPARYIDVIAKSMMTSLIVSSLATLISTYVAMISIPVIARSGYGRLLRIMLKVPLVIPTSALGLAMILLWGPRGLGLVPPGLWLIVLTHVVFSVPVIVETGLASYFETNLPLYEDTARSLGATPYDVMETITIPMIRRGIIAGSLLAFTHSLGETGATFIVMGDHTTVSTLIVNLVESLAIPASIFASLVLILTSIVFIVIIRHLIE